ncbi:MAG: purine-nucleoside phosphorylase [Sumerlaeia bacterium]
MSTNELFNDPAYYTDRIDESANVIKQHVGVIPDTLVIAGSGLGQFADLLENAQSLSYEEIPNFPKSTVVGHAGKLVWGTLKGKGVLVMAGRKHLYEGVDIRESVLPLRALIVAGIRRLIVSNAAGGLNKNFLPGQLMLINDHINMQFQNPLIGKNLEQFGPRFPDLCEPYDSTLMEKARLCAKRLALTLHEGVYISLSGPSYETQAEVGMLKMIGDAVGMSTVPETLVAKHMNIPTLGITAITNSHVMRRVQKTTHEEVIEVGKQVGGDFCRLVTEVICS